MAAIKRTFNVCFPRSGHRFLRNMCKAYFGNDLRFARNNKKSGDSLEDANYIKDHDFGLLGNKAGTPIQAGARYLVQYRHPLESLMSYFEFEVKHGTLNDDYETWASFLPQHLNYWKNFVRKWCIPGNVPTDASFHWVNYERLCDDPLSEMRGVIKFLTNDSLPLNEERLEAAVAQFADGFTRYVEEEKSSTSLIREVRDLKKFKYFEPSLARLEADLRDEYLGPLGIERKLFSDQEQALCQKEKRAKSSMIDYHKLLDAHMEMPGAFQDCYAFSIHKSGSTLMHRMIAEVCRQAGIPAISIPDILFREGIFEHWGDDERILELFVPGRIYFGFRHLPNAFLNASFELKSKRSVLLVRDPRDALVSQYFSFGGKNISHTLPGKNREIFLDRASKTSHMEIDEYVLHSAPNLRNKLNAYKDALNFDQMLLFKYEDIFFDKRKFLQDIFSHFGISVDHGLLDRVAADNDVRPAVEDATKHIRKGTPGDHASKLRRETIEKLNSFFAQTCRCYGYELSVE